MQQRVNAILDLRLHRHALHPISKTLPLVTHLLRRQPHFPPPLALQRQRREQVRVRAIRLRQPTHVTPPGHLPAIRQSHIQTRRLHLVRKPSPTERPFQNHRHPRRPARQSNPQPCAVTMVQSLSPNDLLSFAPRGNRTEHLVDVHANLRYTPILLHDCLLTRIHSSPEHRLEFRIRYHPEGDSLSWDYDFRGSDKMLMAGWDYEETMSPGPATGPLIRHAALEILQGR